MEIDIVFNIDYPSQFEVGPLYAEVPKYIEYIEVKNIAQLRRLVERLKDNVICFIWLHPSFSSEQVSTGGIKSKITTEVLPELKYLQISFTQITRSTGKTSGGEYFDVDKMLDIRKTKKSYRAYELRAILSPTKSVEVDSSTRPRLEESILDDIRSINTDFIPRKKFLKSIINNGGYWFENLFPIDSNDIRKIFDFPYWHFKKQVINTFLNLSNVEQGVINEKILSLPEIIEFDENEKKWMIDFGFFDEVSKRFESQSQHDYRAKLKVASSIYVIHETIHKQHNLDRNTVNGIGNFPRIIEEADYQADSIAILIELAYFIQSDSSISIDEIIDKLCSIIEIAIETTFSFNPIQSELKLIQVRRVNRYLIWLIHYLRLKNLKLKSLPKEQLLLAILKQFSVKPIIEISGPAIKSNVEMNRSFYDLNKIIHQEEIAVLKIDNQIVRMGPLQSIEFSNFYEAIKQSNFKKLIDFFKVLFDNNKGLLDNH